MGEVETLAADADIAAVLTPTYLRKHQRDEHNAEIAAIERQLADPVERKRLHNPGRLAQDVQRRRRNVDAQTPPPLTPIQRDKISRLERACVTQATPGMVSAEELRSRPTGVTDQLVAWDAANKSAVLLWKRCRLLLNPDSAARDLCNFERFRPARPESRNLYTDSPIPRIWTLSEEAKRNFAQIDWSGAEGQAVNAEIQRLTDEGKIKINLDAERGALRGQADHGPVYECKHETCGGRIFSGRSAKQNYDRHMKATTARKGGVVAA